MSPPPSEHITDNAPRVSLAHDWLVGMRGGEFVLDRLARLYGPTTLYTLVRNNQPLSDAIEACTVRTSALQRMPGAPGRLRRWYLPLAPLAVERLRVEPCELLISTSSSVIKAIHPPDGAAHLCYCHSPARYIWEQTDDYSVGSARHLRSLGLRLMRRPFKRWDRRTAARVTRFLANSAHTAARIQRCYGREAAVVYPPVRTNEFTPDPGVPRQRWLLVVAALEPYKRVDLAIGAAQRTGRHLKVIGDGSQAAALRAQARRSGAHVEFLGQVGPDLLREHYRRAAALVFPQLEDFGIAAVEAQAAGCPVIAFAGGGALESVTDATGLFFADQSVDALADAIDRFDRHGPFDPAACRRNAERFNEAAFDDAIRRHVHELTSHASAQRTPRRVTTA